MSESPKIDRSPGDEGPRALLGALAGFALINATPFSGSAAGLFLKLLEDVEGHRFNCSRGEKLCTTMPRDNQGETERQSGTGEEAAWWQ